MCASLAQLKSIENKKKNLEIAILFWTDAAMHGIQQRLREDWLKVGLIEGIACGIVIYEDKKQITIAMDYFPDDDGFRQVASYPKSGINKIIRKELKSLSSSVVIKPTPPKELVG